MISPHVADFEDAVYENPFCAARLRPGVIDYVFPPGTDLPSVVETLSQNAWQGQIIGPHGTGKSTLLAMLLRDLRARGHAVHDTALHDGQRALPADYWERVRDVRTILAIDGFEQLSSWNRWRIRRYCRSHGLGLIVTAHGSTGLPTLIRTAISTSQACQVAERLQRDYIYPIGLEDMVDRLRARQGNLREALFDLYDLYEAQIRSR
jgi:hypothetical protein